MQLIIDLKTSLWHVDRAKWTTIHSAKRLEVRKQGGSEKKKDSLILQHFLQKYECEHLHTPAIISQLQTFYKYQPYMHLFTSVQCCACNASDALKQSPLLQQCKMLKFPAVKMPFPPRTKILWPTTSPVSHAQSNQTQMVFRTNKSSIKLNICFVSLNQKEGFSCNSSILTGAIAAYI